MRTESPNGLVAKTQSVPGTNLLSLGCFLNEEPHRHSTNALNLNDYYLTDDYANPAQWQFPVGATLNAGASASARSGQAIARNGWQDDTTRFE